MKTPPRKSRVPRGESRRGDHNPYLSWVPEEKHWPAYTPPFREAKYKKAAKMLLRFGGWPRILRRCRHPMGELKAGTRVTGYPCSMGVIAMLRGASDGGPKMLSRVKEVVPLLRRTDGVVLQYAALRRHWPKPFPGRTLWHGVTPPRRETAF